MEMTTMCLHQFSRPKLSQPSNNGRGNCLACKTDEHNKFCTGYCPIKVILITINKEEKDDDK